jgi:signal transduction histidine kinase
MTAPGGMKSPGAHRALRSLRLRLTAWYVGTFAVVLAVLGVLLFAAQAHYLSTDLDASLRAATKEIARAAERREVETARAGNAAIDAVTELRIPDRELYLLDTSGVPLTPAIADSEVRALARSAAAHGSATGRWDAPGDLSLQAYAERFVTRAGAAYVAVAVVNRDAADDRYETLLAIAGALAAVALVLVATGGWLLAKKSVAPVEESMERMRRFMADAAHELRTPVAVIRSRVDVSLEQARDAAAYERTMQELRGEVERLGTLVNDLFTLARADADERAFVPARVQLDELVLEAVTTAGWIASRRGVALSVTEAEEAVISGDAALLRQLVLIILDNAIKFSADGGAVRVALNVDAEGSTLTVVDEGLGIAPADIPHVFERFYRSESVRGTTAGAGLGLAIARWIAELHGAEISIAAEPARGTRVTVRFPAAATGV